jgi:DNA-binding NarL/FixJ family response regulator
VADEPIRLAGLASIFEQPSQEGKPPLLPISGSLEELLAQTTLEYLVVDLSSASGGLEILNSICLTRPNIRLIVIGPEGNDELVMDSIIAGARGYLELTAGPEMVRRAIDAVTGGSIWAPRRLLSKLIDRLLKVSDTSLISSGPRLTEREREVLDHILMARSNREIARHLGIEERTVKAHVGRLMRKTGSDNRIELSMRALHLPQATRGKAGQGNKGRSSNQ